MRVNSWKLMWFFVNYYEFICRIKTNLFTCTWIYMDILTWFYFESSVLFRIYDDLFDFIWKHARRWTAAPLEGRTVPRALPDRRTPPCALLRTLLHTLLHAQTQQCALPLPQTAAHCMNSNARQPQTAQCILHTAHTQSHPVINMIYKCCVWIFTKTYMNLGDLIWIHMNKTNFIWKHMNII